MNQRQNNKINTDKNANSSLENELIKLSPDGQIPCVVAFEVAKSTNVKPDNVGRALDDMKISISKCQLGLFGYKPEKKIVTPANAVSSDLEQSINQALVNDRLPCSAAWDISKNTGKAKLEIAEACEALGVKISPCQLGAF